MKTLVHVLLIAACFVACARSFPSIGYDEDDEDNGSYDFHVPDFFSDFFSRVSQHINNIFHNIPDVTDMQIPEGANTTSTTKVINGHVVTINETTYSSGDELGGTAFRIRIIDVKPQNDTDTIGGGLGPASVKPETNESRETVEDFNNEISKNTETLTA
ncbi:hypothetical protein PUN28_009985 [Cardiocondyla obscurior]|uniref:Icarapin-like n=1 Tax=Cardiocondyla obscurior TaxID=286306 RepID=A0AAW2FPQ2_9HYME